MNEVVALDKLVARAEELAEALAANSPASLLATKRLRTFSHVELDRQVAATVDENARTPHDFREGWLLSWKNLNPIEQEGRL